MGKKKTLFWPREPKNGVGEMLKEEGESQKEDSWRENSQTLSTHISM